MHKPTYEALSYTWGPPENDMARITIEHQEQDQPNPPVLRRGSLGARSNLISALCQLRHQSEPRDVWIDAICIDQDDITHKGHQVTMMGEIYSHASRVIVWLGPASHESSRAMELIRSLGVQVDMNFDDSLNVTASRQALDPDIADLSKPLTLTSDNEHALFHLFGRKWFDRLWIRQEIFRANQATAVVYCGAAQVQWYVFRQGSYLLHVKATNTVLDGLWERLEGRRSLLVQYRDVWLDNLRQNFVYTQCEDPRDRVYGVRSLLPKQMQQEIYPDYTKPVEDVYKDAVLAHFKIERDVMILSECQFSPEWKGPSWVPNWSIDNATKGDLEWKMASGMIGSSVINTRLPGKCQVMGVYAATVTKLMSPLSGVYNPDTMLDYIQTVLSGQQNALEAPYPAGGTVIEAFAQTMCDGRFLDKDLEYPHFPRQDVANLVFQYASSKHLQQMDLHHYVVHEIPNLHDPKLEITRVLTLVFNLCYDRSVIHTANGMYYPVSIP